LPPPRRPFEFTSPPHLPDDPPAAAASDRAGLHFRTLIDVVPHAIWTADPAGRPVYLNRHWREFTGLSAEQTRIDFSHVIHPDDLAGLMDRWRAAQATAAPFQAEYRVRRAADGQYRWQAGTAHPRRAADGRVIEWVGAATDIHDRKLAEAQLREQAERLRAALEASGTGTFRWEISTDALTWDENLDRLFGLPPGVTARSLAQFIAIVHPDDRQGIIDRCDLCRRDGADFHMEFRVVYPDGSVHWLDDHGKTFRDPHGRPAYMTGACTDITARKNAEAELRAGETRFRELAESIPLIVWTARPDGHVDYYNKRWSDYTGFPVDALLGAGWQAAIHADDLPATGRAWELSVRTGSELDIVHRIRGGDRLYRWFHLRAVPVKDAAGRVTKWYGTASDIHEQKVAEAQLRRAQAEAEAASTAKDRFLAALSHELRTPLNPALIVLSSLLENPDLPASLRDDVATAKRNIELETHLIDDLLDVTRITQGKMHLRRETVSLHDLLRHAWAAATGGGALTAGAPRPVWALDAARHHTVGDPARLQQVFWNLLKNAMKFTPDDGTITIATSNPQPDRVRITFTDTGIGISREALKRIFTPFEQGTPTIGKVFGGLGLGLAIARGIIDLHGGAISAHSAGTGRGATFTLEFAAASPADARPKPPAVPAGARPLRILLVEDHVDTARTMAKVLAVDGHAVKVARTMADGLDLLAGHAFDVVITDLGLPDGSGRDLIRHLKKNRPGLPVVALSGYGMAEDIEQSLHAGAIAHLTKPVNLPLLRESLAQIAPQPV
jgi:PAS domain S-box-containing protein